MNIFDTQSKNRGGSALIIVVVLVVLLSIVGFTFVMISRLDAVGSKSLLQAAELDNAMNYMVSRVGDVIVADVETESYDYPGDEDEWLASLEPYIDATISSNDPNQFVWAQISDVFGLLSNDGISVTDVHADPTGISDSNGRRETIDEYQEIFIAEYNQDVNGDTLIDVRAGDLLQEKPDENLDGSFDYRLGSTGQFADADGDGVADSKWFKVPNLRTADGEYHYAAVRIIDNSGMVNVNTAYKFDDTQDYLCDGATQINVNLEGLLNPSDDIEDVFDVRGPDGVWSGTNDQRWLEYKGNVVDRLSNPDKGENYQTFSLVDEASLRDRFCIYPGFTSRIEAIGVMDDTLVSDWGGKEQPYMGVPYGTLLDWGVAVTGGDLSIDPDRRHLLTTMSISREMTPVQIVDTDLSTEMQVIEGRRKAYTRPILTDEATALGVENLSLKQIVGNVYYAIKDQNLTGSFGDYKVNGTSLTDAELVERVSWHFALNLADYQYENVGEDNLPSYKRVDDKIYFGFEGIDALLDDTLIVSEYAYYHNPVYGVPGNGNNPRLESDTSYYMIELYNPSPNAKTITQLNNYRITITDPDAINIRKIDLYRDVFHSNNTVIQGGEIFLICSNRQQGHDRLAFGVEADYEYLSLNFAKDDMVFVHKLDWPEINAIDSIDMPVDRCIITLPLDTEATIESAQRRDEFGEGTGLLIPAESDLRWSSYLIIGSTFGNSPVIRNFIDMNLEVSNDDILTIGEICNVFAVGAYSDPAIVNDIPFTSSLEKSTYKLGDGNPSKVWGHFDFANSNAGNIFNYLTLFKTAWDGVDNDGIKLTSDNPMNDGIDNDSDGTDDNPGEEVARYRETLVHGRVNINTASATVLEQLPWITEELAAAIVARRDRQKLYAVDDATLEVFDYTAITESKGFNNIVKLLDVTNDVTDVQFGTDTNGDKIYGIDYDIQQYGKDESLVPGFSPNPDFAPDTLIDDYKEKAIVFQRISNSITVSSDVFTAYILLRAGAEGSQRRLIVIYDRTGVFEEGDKPAVIVQQASLLGR